MSVFVRLRRATPLSLSSIIKDRSFSSITSSSSSFHHLSNPRIPAESSIGNPSLIYPSQIQSSSFHSSVSCSIRRVDPDQNSKIPEDEILFEGCDYNHWLITMDFPKDPKPSPEEMVETYVQTLAKVVGSVEEAKKKMYACSTTTYNGFQAVMSEEMSEKFRGLPGVVFILPDSYIDPINKEYGGDKYDNGVITPRPPPIQYGRRGRYGDGNRRYDQQQRYDQQRSPSPPMQGRDPSLQNGNQQMHQGYPPNEYQGPRQGYGRNYGPQQSYGQPGPDRRGYDPARDMQQGNPATQQGNPATQQGYPATQQGYPATQQGYPQMQQRNPQMQQGNPQMQQRNTQMQQGYPPVHQGYLPVQQGYPPVQQGYPPVQQGNPQMQQSYPHMQQGNLQVPPGNQAYSHQDPMQDGDVYSPQQNHGPPGRDGRR